MTLRDIVELAYQRFRTRSLRFFLTVLGVSIGISVVFFLVSLGFGLQEVVIGRIATSESLLALDVVSAEGTERILPINEETLQEFRKIEHVQDVSPLLSVPAEIRFAELRAQTLIQAVHPSYFRYSGIKAGTGQTFGDSDTQVALISSTALRLFDINEPQSAINKELRLTFFFPKLGKNGEAQNGNISEDTVNVVEIPQPFRIVGVIEAETNNLFIPLRALSQFPDPSYAQVKIRVDVQDSLEPVRRVLAEKGFTVRALTDTLDQLNKIFRITQGALASLGVIALFIASVGMFNTLTISLLERTREVGILKTIGATNRDVWKIFLFEAVLIGILGGIIGVLTGILLSQGVNAFTNTLAKRFGGEPTNIFATPLWFLISIIVGAMLVGLLTGLYPARRAARLNPLDALRRE